MKDTRSRILNAMEELFQEGLAGTASVSDIARKAGIAKGGLYYYFKSKEEVMDALIDKVYDDIITNCSSIIQNFDGNALEKLKLFLYTYKTSYVDPSLDEYLHMPSNAALHQKSLVNIQNALTDCLTPIINEGIDEGIFQTEYPKQYVRMLLSCFTYLYDPGLFTYDSQEMMLNLKALADMLENGLHAKKGSFSFLFLTSPIDSKS